MSSRSIVVLLASFLLVPGCAARNSVVVTTPGAIRGILQMPKPAASAASAVSMSPGAAAPREIASDAVIYIERLPDPPPVETPVTPAAKGATRPAGASAATVVPKAMASSGANGRSTAPGTSTANQKAPAARPTRPARVYGPEEEPRHAVMGQADHRFIPRVLPIPTGTTVRFENRDRVYHNAFSISPARVFDIGKYAPRQSREVRFDTPGVVQLYSDIDPSMAGFVFVTPTRFFTQPDAMGVFTLPNLPRGTYTVKVWHPTLGRLARQVELPAQGDADVTLRF